MARITAHDAVDIDRIDLHSLISEQTSRHFFDNINAGSAQGYTYPDVLQIGFLGDVASYANWGGNNLSVNASTGAMTGGTITGFLEDRFNGSAYVPALAIEGFAYSAVAISNAMQTTGTADDMVILAAVLAGADSFSLSNLADSADGFAGNDTLRGYAGNDTLYGGAGNDWIDGGSGSDRMAGGTGNDTYVVNSAGDVTTETSTVPTEIDSVRSSVTRTLGANLENLTLIGSAAINATGNALNNSLLGNAAANVLNGGDGNDVLNGAAGADTMAGGYGHDTFYVDNVGDVTTDTSFSPFDIDSVRSSVSYALGAYIENLTLTGNAAINGTGNGLTNTLVGNAANNTLRAGDDLDYLDGGAGNDVLDGGASFDVMAGGAGDDSFYVDHSGDHVVENGGGGYDRIYASVSRLMEANVERLTLTGTRSIYCNGNETANVIVGNVAVNGLNGAGGNDSLYGLGGDDELNGGSGQDLLDGGTGNDKLVGGYAQDHGQDRFRFSTVLNASTNLDRLPDFVSADDRIELGHAIFTAAGPLGALAAVAFHIGASAADASDRIVYNQGTGALYYDADGSGAAAAVQFATLTPGTAVALSDFLIV